MTTAVLDERDDAALIAAVREGDTEAYGVLFERHVDAARRLARTLARGGDADDLVSEAFAKVLPVLIRGEGPDVAFRPYLLTAIRRLDVDRHRSLTRTRPTDDDTVLDAATRAGEMPSELAVAGFESAAAARAFASLPERWQLVLWHTEVEGQGPAEVAPLLGLSANAVSQLAHRAREGLRQAFVSMHVQDAGEARSACQTTRANLGAYIRGGLSHREAARVSAHLRGCRPCTAIYLELVEVDTDLRGVLAPLLLGGAATAYLSDVPVAAAPSALASAGELLRTGAGKVLAGTAAAGVAVGVFVLGGAALLGGHDDDPGVAANPPAPTAPTETADRAGRPDRPHHHSAGSPSGTVPAAAVTPGPTSGTPAGPAQQPSPEPSHQPTAQPTHEPTHQPSATPIPTPSPTPSPVADPTAVDLRVSAAKVGLGPAAVVTVGWAGLGRGQTGTVTLTADHLAASVSLDPRCDLLGINTATCRVAGDGSLQLVGLGGLLGPTTLTITVAPGPGLHDPSPGDNTTRVVLGP